MTISREQRETSITRCRIRRILRGDLPGRLGHTHGTRYRRRSFRGNHPLIALPADDL